MAGWEKKEQRRPTYRTTFFAVKPEKKITINWTNNQLFIKIMMTKMSDETQKIFTSTVGV